MRKYLIILGVVCSALATNGQTYMTEQPTLSTITQQFESWLEEMGTPDYPDDHVENELDGLHTKFMRWHYLMQTRTDAEGHLPHPASAARAWKQYKEMHPGAYSTRAAGWEPVGTADVPANGGGAGRLNVVVLHPDDPNILFVGAAGGGVWKSPDAGSTWIHLSADFPVTSIADLAIDPVDPDIIYAVTGDGYGYEATWQSDNDFWGGVYSAGIMKTTDGGLTWNPTGLSYEQDELQIVQRLLIHPENTNILLAATRSGIYRSTDSGDSWTMVEVTHCHDMDFNTDDPNTVYAVGDRDVFVSEDAGLTWSILKNNLGAAGDRMSIETTADDPQLIYVLSGYFSTSFFKSTDGGTTWTTTNSPGSQTYFFGYYDNAFDVSNVNGNIIFAGGLEVVRSVNGASAWQKKSNWDSPGSSGYVHADNHGFACHPSDENIVYSANDGGLFRSEDKGDTWTDISDGLRIAQVYRLGTSATDPERVLSGWQDNGTNLWDGSSWEEIDVSTWDGMEAIIDFTDSDIMFLTHQYGALYRTTNGGASWTYMSPSGGNWVTPYVMDPNDHQVLYYGGNGGIYRTTNGGNTWVYKNASLGSYAFALAVAPSNSNVVYAAALNKIVRSSNMGDTWTNVTSDLPVGSIDINYIAVSDINEDVLWVALSGYEDGEKVFRSDDGGSTWVNVSGTLPNVPVNTVVFENGSDNRIYVGTDIGVFYRDASLADWVPYQTGLPLVMIHELEINYTSQKLVAATYGMGIWQSDLAEAPVINTLVSASTYCNGEDMIVDYASTVPFESGNILTAELSDATGSFAAPVVIGTLDATAASGSIPSAIPTDTEPAANYRIRVSSSLPAVTGLDNGFNITIDCGTPDGLSLSEVGTSTATLSWNAVYCAVSYEIRYRPVGGSWTGTTSLTNSVDIAGLTPFTDYEWSVKTVCLADPEITSAYSDNAVFSTINPNAIGDISTDGFSVYPNPAATTTEISWNLPASGNVVVRLTDIRGRIVSEVTLQGLSSGAHTYRIERGDLDAGVYAISIEWNEQTYQQEVVFQ